VTPPTRKILVVGPYPPPIGGVSTHVQRLARALSQRGFRVEIVNHYAGRPDPIVVDSVNKWAPLYWWRLRRRTADIVHFHYSRRVLHLMAVAAARRANRGGVWVMTVHGHGMRPVLRAPGPVREAIRRSLYAFDTVVAVSDEVAQWLRDFAPALNVVVAPAYIPPVTGELPDADPELAGFIGDRPGTMVVSAYRIRRYGRGDLYGLDVATEVLAELVRRGHEARLAVFLARAPWDRWGRRYWNALEERAGRPDLAGRVVVRVGQDLLPALRPGVVYLRPTRTDGDAISIREALDLSVPVVASDVVGRPPGVRTLPVDDVAAWVDAVQAEIAGPPGGAPGRPGALSPGHGQTTVDRLIELYDRLVPPGPTAERHIGDPEPVR
jgi:glycosyltransferase involved in cell wall biosynthesis